MNTSTLPGDGNLDLKAIWDAILAMPLTKVPCGIAMSPRTEAILRLRHYDTSPRMDHCLGMLGGVPFIVDPRLTDKSEIFYDNGKWNDRVKEQNTFDTK